jgi:hypothetical protein
LAYDTRNEGVGATPPFYSGSSVNPAPRNPRCDPVTVAPGAAPTPPPAAPLRPTVRGTSQMPIPPGGGPNRGPKQLT